MAGKGAEEGGHERGRVGSERRRSCTTTRHVKRNTVERIQQKTFKSITCYHVKVSKKPLFLQEISLGHLLVRSPPDRVHLQAKLPNLNN